MRASATRSTPGHRTWSTSSPARSMRPAPAAVSPAASRVGASNRTHRAPTSRAGCSPGALAYLETPGAHRFAVSQDTGAAIVGAHADLFLGAGAEAEDRAGRTRERGALYLLLPR